KYDGNKGFAEVGTDVSFGMGLWGWMFWLLRARENCSLATQSFHQLPTWNVFTILGGHSG
ncbi:unnamed protein product, partial [Ilex paraguariensis]